MTTESAPRLASPAALLGEALPELLRLQQRLSLSGLEFDLLLQLLAAAIDPDQATALQALQQEPIGAGVRLHTLSRALGHGGRLTGPLSSALAPEGTLRTWGLLQRTDPSPMSMAFERYIVPREVVGLSLGRPGLSPLVEQAGELLRGQAQDGQELHRADARQLLRTLASGKCAAVVARDLVSLRAGLAGLAASVGHGLLWVAIDEPRGDGAGGELRELLRVALRDALLHGAVLVLVLSPEDSRSHGGARQERLHRLARQAKQATVPLLFIKSDSGGRLGDLELRLRAPELPQRRAYLESALHSRGLRIHADSLQQVAEQFQLGLQGLGRAVERVSTSRLASGSESAVQPVELGQAIAAEFAEVAAGTGDFLPDDDGLHLDDLKLPEDVTEDLLDLMARCRYRRQVFEGMRLGRLATTTGVVSLFVGPPGTGKTMAARVLCSQLGLRLLRIDLARLVSKWIGETEKNLAQVLDAAEDGLFAVLFDEADSLFGARTANVQSSADRYANMQTNYLLQRFDTFSGVAFLTSNFERGIDEAFKRRLTTRIEFPMPEKETRAAIWRGLVPGSLRLSQRALMSLAKTELSGGYIRNAVLRAAFRAARLGRPLRRADLAEAVAAELRAQGRLSEPIAGDIDEA